MGSGLSATPLGTKLKIMANESNPILLLVSELIKPIELTREKVNNIENALNKANHQAVVMQGLFVLLISSLEIMITDILKYYLINIPSKLNSEFLKFSKEEILSISNSRKLLSNQIDKYVNSLSYERIDVLWDIFINILSIEEKSIDSDVFDRLSEMKETRNLLLHNNLYVNSNYLEKSGKYKRANHLGNKLEIDKDYFIKSLETVNTIIDWLELNINEKYKSFTRIKALKELWIYIFGTQFITFDDFWNYNEAEDKVNSLKRNEIEGNLASSEKMFLGMWRVHFNGDSEYLNKFSMKRLDQNNQEKMLYFISIMNDFKLY